MMKRSRVDEVQFGTRPSSGTASTATAVGAATTGAVVVGGGGATTPGQVAGANIGVSPAAAAAVVAAGGGVTIGTVVQNAHGAGGIASISGLAGNIAHHRILTPQHGGAQTIAYLPSTTPSAAAATNLKTTSNIVDSGNNSNATTGVQTTVSSIGGVVPAAANSVVVSTGSAGTQTLQYTTSYSVAGGTLKASTVDGNTVQIHVASGQPAGNAVQQNITSGVQTAVNIRQRTLSGTNSQSQSSNSSGSYSAATTQQQISAPALVAASAGTNSQQSTPPANSVSGNSTPPQGVSAGAGTGAQSSGNATPRLKVEDALSYLDQVKYQYADQPQIYNNFLDIMKEFKSHNIDTPGVIERVSTLFKGHTELIYGFNMFLPPGYKIEIHSDALGISVPVVSMPSPPGAPSSTGIVHMIASSPLAASTSNSGSPAHTLKTQTVAGTAATITPSVGGTSAPSGAVNLMTHGGASLTQTTIHALQQQQPSQQSSQSPSHVHVNMTTSAAAAAVAAGQQPTNIAVVAPNVPQNYSRDRERATITPTGQIPQATGASIVVGGPPTPNSLSDLSPPGGQHNLHHIQQAHQSILLGETNQQNQPVEFNHAITYVNKIKNRFQNQPAKYKKFLEILHAYQKEQKVIKEGTMNQGKMLTEQEVYTQVAKLFGQDEDLLREFGQFLPDATNHQSSQYMSKGAALHNDHNKQQQRTTATLSGGAHISMPSIGSPLHLSSGATLSQISADSTNAHAAAIGNLSAVNTSVSIKSYNNNNANHVTAVPRNDLLYDNKDYGHGLTGLQQQQHRSTTALHLSSASSNIRTASTAGILPYEKDHRNNHHAQKYMGLQSQQQQPGIGGAHHSAKKSPSYVSGGTGVAGIPSAVMGTALPLHMSENSMDRSSPGINYATAMNQAVGQQLPAGASMHLHHHPHHLGATGQRRTLDVDSGMGAGGMVGGPPPAKRPKPYGRDVSFSEAARKCSITDAAYFDKVRKALRNPEVYENFLRCLTLFNQEIVSKTELLSLVTPFLSKFPDLLRGFTDFLGPPATCSSTSQIGGNQANYDTLPLAAAQRQGSGGAGSSSSHERASSHQSAEYVPDIDLLSCKRLGASYCALPPSTVPKKCSGRTALCREVLNDKWVSFPTWASEDSTFVTSRKTQFEETIYRTEDERFELDLVIEVNSATIRVLENVQKKMSRMSPEELCKFHLDDHLGGTSQTIHQRAIHRIYGDKSGEIIQGMKKNPAVAVPIVLKRLKVKEEEWRDAQKTFNKQWREQNEKYYLKSLDHQAINFKPNDMKALRSKSLFNEIETLFDERHMHDDDKMETSVGRPHLVLPYKDKTILDDAANLLIHHVKRQTGIQKQEKQKIKQIIRQFVPDLFYAPRQPLSDDERDDAFPFLVDDNTKMDVDSPLSRTELTSASLRNAKHATSHEASSPARSNVSSSSSSAGGGGSSTNNNSPTASIKKETSAEEAKAAAGSGATGDDGAPSTSAAAAAAAETSKVKEESSTSANDAASTAANAGNSTPPNKTAEEAVNDLDIKIERNADFVSPLQLPPHAQGQHEDESYSLFMGNNNWYLFLRLHAILCERLHLMYDRARLLAIEEEKCRVNRRESTATALRLKPKPDVQVEDYYPTFLDMLKNVLDGNMDSNTFEDTMREMFGIYAYISFTLDKVVSNAVRQLQNCVTERAALDCVELFANEQRRGGTGGFCRDAHKSFEREISYQRKAENMLNDENCFKVFIYKIDCRVTIELLETEPEEVEKPNVKAAQKFSNYVDRLANPASTGSNNNSPGGGGGGNHSSSSTIVTISSGENVVEMSDIKMEEEDENAEPGRMRAIGGIVRKARFLLRNKRKSRLHEEQVRQLFEQKRISNSKGASSAATANEAAADSTSANNNNNNNKCWNKRMPERLGAPQVGLAEQYAFNDRDEITTNASNGRCFVTSKNLKLLKYDAVRRAKNSHCRVTQRKYVRFQGFINKWLQQHVSEQSQQHCNDWLLGKTAEQINASGWGATNRTKSLQQKDTTKTPYRIYMRYKVLNSTSNPTTSTGANSTTTVNVNSIGSSNSSSSSTTTTAAATTATVVVATAVPTAVTSAPTLSSVSSSNSIVSISSSSSSIVAADTTTPSAASQQHCNSAAAATTGASTNAEALQQVRPMES